MHLSYAFVTFIIASSEGSPEGAPSPSLPIWDLLQIYQGIGQRLSVHMEHLTSLSVLPRPGQHQGQLKQEDVHPLTETDIKKVQNNLLIRYYGTILGRP